MANERPERWLITNPASCVGLTVYWRVPLAALQAIVGPHLKPLEGDEPGYGSFGLFAASGEALIIGAGAADGAEAAPPAVAASPPAEAADDAPTTSFALGVALVPVAEPDDWRGTLADVWVASVETICPASHPLAALFRRHGFAVTDGQVLVSLGEDSMGSLASFFIATKANRVEATAAFSDAGRARSSANSLIVGTDPHLLPAFGGAESARRHSQGQATVRSMGVTWLSRLGLPSHPTSTILDTDLAWNFVFYGRSVNPAADPAGHG